jgi:hypothetical protein
MNERLEGSQHDTKTTLLNILDFCYLKVNNAPQLTARPVTTLEQNQTRDYL